jgi:hypothetical protein
MEKFDEPSIRNFIFGEESQSKLVELGDFDTWLLWLKENLDQEEQKLTSLAEQEIERPGNPNLDNVVDKWKLKIKIISPSHSIRLKALNTFNQKHPFISITKGGDNHTLFIEFIIYDNISVGDLWGHGWLTAKLFVAALNIGSNGLFYWNVPVDLSRYYEKITDLTSGHALQLTVSPELRHDWSKLQMVLSEENLFLSDIVFTYFMSFIHHSQTKAITEYTLGLGLLAKNDIHFVFNTEILIRFYNTLKISILNHESVGKDDDWHNIAYTQIEMMINDRNTYDHTVDLAKQIIEGKKLAVSLTDVTAMKNYAGIYFLTLALRQRNGSKTIRLTANAEKSFNETDQS